MPASNFGAGWHDVLYTALILLYMKLKHPLLCCNLIYLFDVDLTQMLYVYWAALHHRSVPGWVEQPSCRVLNIWGHIVGMHGWMHQQQLEQSACSVAAQGR